MRVLLVSGSLPPMRCGVGDYTWNLARALARTGALSVSVLTSDAVHVTPSDPAFEILPVVRSWEASQACGILRNVRSVRPDVIHIQYHTQGYSTHLFPYLLPAFLLPLGVPSVQTWHEYMEPPGLHFLPNALLPGALVAVRPGYLERMPAWFRRLLRHKRFRFIPNASVLPVVRMEEGERAAIRRGFAPPSHKVVAYFGFANPNKGVEELFEIADPAAHHLVLICDLRPENAYHREIAGRARRPEWSDRVTVTGFLPAGEAARLLAAADAVVLPFRGGGGIWNTTLQGAASQGTFVLTTSSEQRGYDPEANIFYAAPDDPGEMRRALAEYAGTRIEPGGTEPEAEWDAIANAHIVLYREILGLSRTSGGAGT